MEAQILDIVTLNNQFTCMFHQTLMAYVQVPWQQASLWERVPTPAEEALSVS